MQKLVRDYLNELKRKQKKRKRVGTAVVLLVILVIGTVIGGLTQAGVAMTGNAKCGIEYSCLRAGRGRRPSARRRLL